ncbi:hypothetical protein [Frigidibacter sp. MR17.24]|uniref:hypothetical protein n=1 Tax=Frigidibacter sp. MR17.24 TaxID=3127345 RepID=UPI00301315D6
MTETELRAALHPPRLPEAVLALDARDLAMALGIGLVLAALAWLLLRPAATARVRHSPAQQAARAAAALAQLPPPERLARRAALFAGLGGRLPADLRAGLYRPLPPHEAEAADARVDRLLAEAVRRAG